MVFGVQCKLAPDRIDMVLIGGGREKCGITCEIAWGFFVGVPCVKEGSEDWLNVFGFLGS